MERSAFITWLVDKILAIQLPHPVRVGIDGVDAAGKTMLADELAEAVARRGRPVIRASIDAFHNPASIRYRRGPLSPEGYYLDSFNYPEARSVLLEPLGPGGNRRYRTQAYDHRRDQPVADDPRTAPEDAVLLFDGIFLQRPELDELLDFVVFLRVDFETSTERALKRDTKFYESEAVLRERYEKRYVDGQRLYLESCHPEERADVVVDHRNPANPIIVKTKET